MNPTDPASLLAQILAALQARQWLTLAPLVILALIWFARSFLRRPIPWLATNAGGAALGILAAMATAVYSAAALPGEHTAASIAVAAFSILIGNRTLFELLKQVGVDLSVDPPAAPDAKPAAEPEKKEVAQ
jgi:hypothetical protein